MENACQRKHLVIFPGDSLQAGKSGPVPDPFTLQSQITKRNYKEASKETGCTLGSLIYVHSFNECIKSGTHG
eukprot:1161821-Pelagomonas_calceolata.AAC.2